MELDHSQQPAAEADIGPMPAAPAAAPDLWDEACRILVRLESPDARGRELLEDAQRQLSSRGADPDALAGWVLGVLRQRARLDYYLSHVSHRPLDNLSPWIRNLLRLSLYQGLFEGAPIEQGLEAVTRVARKHGHDGAVKFAIGCLRELARQMAEDKLAPLPSHPLERLAIESGHPIWLVERLAEDHGFDRAAQVLAAADEPVPFTLRVNPLRAQREAVAARLRSAGLGVELCLHSPWGLQLQGNHDARRMPGYFEGDFHVQDESSQLLGLLMAPQPGWQVADVCAAPGAKTTLLAEMVGPQGKVYAFDRRAGSLDKLVNTLGRQGIRHLFCETRDSLTPQAQWLGCLDGVLVDAPCTSVGVMRRRIEARWQARYEAVGAAVHRQSRLLAASAQYLKPGGVLVYCTSSWDREEDEAVVEEFLAHHPDFIFERAQGFVPRAVCTRDGYLRTWPGQDGMDGFFAARLRKAL